MKNILSIDLESWVHLYKHIVNIDSLSSLDRKEMDGGYMVMAINNLLDILNKYNQTATFFVVAEIFDWYPDIIVKIEQSGHEIAYHTHSHSILKNIDITREELLKSKNFIERFKPKGFRAPQIYIKKDYFAVFYKFGFKYSSSSYGDYNVDVINGIKEIPVSTLFSLGKKVDFPKNLSLKNLFLKIPFGSGLFMVILRSRISNLINYVNGRGKPVILFIHPWQLSNHDKLHSISFKLKVLFTKPLCLLYLSNVLKPFEKMLSKHEFVSFEKYYSNN